MPPRGVQAAENVPPQSGMASLAKDPAATTASPQAPPVPSNILERAGLSRSSDGSYLLSDAFLFRQKVDRECSDPTKTEELVTALSDAWSDPDSLRAALQPTRTSHAAAAAGSGVTSSSIFGESGIKDSVARLLLQCTNVQTALAEHLLEALQGHQDELDSPGCAGMPLAKLVLSQFRWLEHVADGSGALARVRLTRAYHRPALQPAVHMLRRGEKRICFQPEFQATPLFVFSNESLLLC